MIVAEVRVNELDVFGVETYSHDARERLSTVEGWQGLSLWRDVQNREQMLVIYEHDSLQSAENGLVALSDIKLLAEQQTMDYRPAEVLRVRVTGRVGGVLDSFPASSFLSASVRVADPGYGKDLDDEIGHIFDELRYIPGYLGSVHGSNESLDEEIVGLVAWESEAAFKMSLPPGKTPYAVRLFNRVG